MEFLGENYQEERKSCYLMNKIIKIPQPIENMHPLLQTPYPGKVRGLQVGEKILLFVTCKTSFDFLAYLKFSSRTKRKVQIIENVESPAKSYTVAKELGLCQTNFFNPYIFATW